MQAFKVIVGIEVIRWATYLNYYHAKDVHLGRGTEL